jgi:RNA polymerase sigma factor for flagellar operon FliA
MKAITTTSASWDAYTKTRSPQVREQLLLQYLPLVRRLASRMLGSLPRSIRLDDLVSAGAMGLLTSLDNYDPNLGIKFETFAMNRIRGAMVDSLRELDWVPRSIRQKARKIEHAIEELTQKLGRTPDDIEVAAFLDVSPEDYAAMLDEVNVSVLLSLDDSLRSAQGDESTLADLAADSSNLSSHEKVEESEIRNLLVGRIKQLPDQDKLVIALYYYEELTFKEIGDVLGLTESRVSQIHSKAILSLRSSVRHGLNQ